MIFPLRFPAPVLPVELATRRQVPPANSLPANRSVLASVSSHDRAVRTFPLHPPKTGERPQSSRQVRREKQSALTCWKKVQKGRAARTPLLAPNTKANPRIASHPSESPIPLGEAR